MKHYHKNPRQIKTKQFNQLRDALSELGDLSGIVHDLNSDEIIGGNMRSDVFNINHCEIELTHQGETPDEQGTVAHGFVVWKGKRYAYRQVRWTPKQCERANIVANKAGGNWDFDILANAFDMDDLLTWGFAPYELGAQGDGVDYNEAWKGMPEFEHKDLTSFHSVHVHFSSIDDIRAFADLVGQTVTEKTKSIWYPKQKKIEYGEAHES